MGFAFYERMLDELVMFLIGYLFGRPRADGWEDRMPAGPDNESER